MRLFAIAALSATTMLAPALTWADPAAPQTAPAATAQAAPAGTQTAQATPSAAPAVATNAQDSSPELNRIVCRSNPPPTGSRLGGTRECHSVHEWNARTQQDQRTLQKIQATQFRGGGG